jgi:hypothetical protein
MKSLTISFLLLFKPADRRTDPGADSKNMIKIYGAICLIGLSCYVLNGTVRLVDNVINPLTEEEYADIAASNRMHERERESKEMGKKLDSYLSERGLK